MLPNFLKRLWCDHEAAESEEYQFLVGRTYWDENGEYRPCYEGIEHTCKNCGKFWCTDITGYRYYIDSKRNLIEKVEREP